MMKPIRTLIVDDEILARRRIRNLLRGRVDFAVVGECANGHEALSAIKRRAPDLVFLDVQMPDLDGFGALEGLTADQLPVIVFVTAYDQYAVRAFEFHALDYLLKPFDDERFEKTLEWARAQEAREKGGDSAEGAVPPGERDELFREAAETCIQHQLGSTSLLQRKLRIGYGRAARIIDQLHEAGILGPPDGSKPREVLIGISQLDEYCL